MREAAELHEATYNYYAQPCEDNLFEWHFTIRGPQDTPFEKGTEYFTSFEIILLLRNLSWAN